jgi:hypothetical protein
MRGATVTRRAAARTVARDPIPAPLRARLYERGIRALPHTILALCVGGALLLVAWREPAPALSIAWLVRPALAHRLIERLGERLRGRAGAGAAERGAGARRPEVTGASGLGGAG